MLGVILFLFAFILLFSFYNFYWKRKDLPPGPTPWPIVGNLLEIGSKPPGEFLFFFLNFIIFFAGYDVYLKWREKYGPIYTYWLGEKPVIAFCDYSLMNETLIKDGENYTDRDFFNDFYLLVRGKMIFEFCIK